MEISKSDGASRLVQNRTALRENCVTWARNGGRINNNWIRSAKVCRSKKGFGLPAFMSQKLQKKKQKKLLKEKISKIDKENIWKAKER